MKVFWGVLFGTLFAELLIKYWPTLVMYYEICSRVNCFLTFNGMKYY